MGASRWLVGVAMLLGVIVGVGTYTFVYARGFPDPIRITARNQQVTEMACRKCHAEITSAIDPAHTTNPAGGLSCTKCHNDVGHIE